VSLSAKQPYSFFLVLFALFIIFFVWSAINPYDRLTWLLEVLPTIIALPILWLTYKKFPLTPLLYSLILLHAIILLIGGHYTYAEVPLFSWMRDTFDWSRNYYDRLGHFAQGFIPAMIAREILLRQQVVKSGAWLFFIVCCICLSISACYEFIEWWVAVAAGGTAEAFLGLQGDVWDTQWDMLTALIGAVCAQIFLKRRHNQQLVMLERKV
jgi:putative membrane protein